MRISCDSSFVQILSARNFADSDVSFSFSHMTFALSIFSSAPDPNDLCVPLFTHCHRFKAIESECVQSGLVSVGGLIGGNVDVRVGMLNTVPVVAQSDFPVCIHRHHNKKKEKNLKIKCQRQKPR